MSDRSKSNRAPVWAYFEPLDEVVGRKGQVGLGGRCKLCNLEVAQSDASTSTLVSHIKVHHKDEWPGLRAAMDEKRKERSERKREYDEAGALAGDMPG